MKKNPTYQELEEKVKELEKEAAEFRKAEEALRENEVRLKVVLDTIQAGIVVIDPENHTIVGVNAAAGKMFGAPREQILGSVCHEYICPAEEGQCPITDLGQDLDNAERELLTAEGRRVPILKTVVSVTLAGREHLLESFLDITERKRAEEERERLIGQLQNALAEVKTLSGLLPLCSSCKRIRDDKGYWQQIEAYIRDHSEAEFSHSVCPECAKKLYPEVFEKEA
jgi:PAS domain S-box-containing protein